jgi:hypothetical protein
VRVTVLAHSGKFTWDEMLYVAIPVVILAVLAWQARHKLPPEEPGDGDEDDGREG